MNSIQKVHFVCRIKRPAQDADAKRSASQVMSSNIFNPNTTKRASIKPNQMFKTFSGLNIGKKQASKS